MHCSVKAITPSRHTVSRELRERLTSSQATEKFVDLIGNIRQRGAICYDFGKNVKEYFAVTAHIFDSEMYEIQALSLKITYRKLRPFVVNFFVDGHR